MEWIEISKKKTGMPDNGAIVLVTQWREGKYPESEYESRTHRATYQASSKTFWVDAPNPTGTMQLHSVEFWMPLPITPKQKV